MRHILTSILQCQKRPITVSIETYTLNNKHSYAPHSQKFSTSHFYIGNVPGRWLLRFSYCALKKNVAMRLTPQPLVAMHLTPSLFFFNLFRRSRRMLQCAWPPSLLRCDQISRARVLLPNVWLVCCLCVADVLLRCNRTSRARALLTNVLLMCC
jgi:hypothetical protein